MKNFLAGLMAIALLAANGCTESTPGGPGATNTPGSPDTTTTTAKKPVLGQADETFSLTVPILSTQVVQGATNTASIRLTRGKNFDEDVTLQFENVPHGVTIEPAAPVIKPGEKEANVTVHAADSAELGDFTINVIGLPTQGAEAKTEFKLTVAKK